MGEIRELPILYSTSMVQAIIDERKDTTRRAINPQPEDGLHNHTLLPISVDSTLKGWWGVVDETGESKQFNCPYGTKGDIMYVREEHYRWGYWVENGKTETGVQKYRFTASNDIVRYFDNAPEKYPSANRKNKEARTIGWYKRNARFMPKSAARIWLEVVSIGVERLQDITDDGAKAEGIMFYKDDNGRYRYKDYMADARGYGNPSTVLIVGMLTRGYG